MKAKDLGFLKKTLSEKNMILSMKEIANYIEKKKTRHVNYFLFSLTRTLEMSIGFIFSANIFMAKFPLPFHFLSGSVAARVCVDFLVSLKGYIVPLIF